VRWVVRKDERRAEKWVLMMAEHLVECSVLLWVMKSAALTAVLKEIRTAEMKGGSLVDLTADRSAEHWELTKVVD
jgi:hypothetical protein